MEPFLLSTERLELRPFATVDTDEVFHAVQDPEIQRWVTLPSPYGRQDAVYFVERVSGQGLREGTGFHFAVRPRGGGPLIGAVGIGVQQAPGTWELGFWTAPEHRRRGYLLEAADAVIRWAVATLPVDRIFWRALVGNEPSRALALKLGFTMEGVQRAATLHHGIARDSWSGSLLPSDLGLPAKHPYLPAGDLAARDVPAGNLAAPGGPAPDVSAAL
ncbi:GNAT family N-acetyltransferase [Streptomyces sp. NBC_00237]|uniref:GNAT family N-acetyltransferase n=1 Tax=Streptomyces sp. NBC_00237 TaxID=2975687 RepID=UPI0022564B94|nr:GNAT family N-acetyltransferase [Streptomyces sp. NBC_00237]MCX5200853.1 GNAT family N-acetyltransferase [Streptomyces sp. NBC_00237]